MDSLSIYLTARYQKRPNPRSAGSIIGRATIAGTCIEYDMAQPYGCASLTLAELNTLFLSLHTIDPVYTDSNIEIVHDCQSISKITEKTSLGEYKSKPIQNSDLVKQIRDLISKFPNLTIGYTKEPNANIDRASKLALESAVSQIRNNLHPKGTTNGPSPERFCSKNK